MLQLKRHASRMAQWGIPRKVPARFEEAELLYHVAGLAHTGHPCTNMYRMKC